MEQKIIEILKDINPYVEIELNTELIEEDILDSLGIVLLIQQIEELMGVKISLEDVTLEDFQDVSTIKELIERVKG